MGLKQVKKFEFKMKPSCINQEKNQLVQVETKMVHGQTTRNDSQDSLWFRFEKEDSSLIL